MKRKNNLCLLLITTISFFILTGCVDNNDLEIWIVEKEMPLYESHIDDNQKIVSTLQMGDTCVPGKRETEKVFQYREILCLKSGYGWVADDFFKKKNKQNIIVKQVK